MTEPTTEAGRRLLKRESLNSRSFTLIEADAITAIEREAVAAYAAKVLPFLRHGSTCALQAVRDNAPDDELCTCGLREAY